MNVAFLIYNRPELTARVFAEIAGARPSKLLVVADGPRQDRPGDAERVAAARSIVERIDWPCEVLRNYSDVNLGCRKRVSSGLDWVFSQVEETIILEDDCLPHPSFFRFCVELLHRYRDDERIVHISGNNFQNGIRRGEHSYYFSRHNHIWGWASWRRAWKHYDVDLKDWPRRKSEGWLGTVLADPRERNSWAAAFDAVRAGSLDTWDAQWAFACWTQNGLAVLPNVNLVSNIGFGAESTHTVGAENPLAGIATADVGGITHPPEVIQDVRADKYTFTLANGDVATKRHDQDDATMKKILKRVLYPIRSLARRFVNIDPPAADDSTIFKAANILAAEKVEGDYVEFGVCAGRSLIRAYHVVKQTIEERSAACAGSSPHDAARLLELWDVMRFFAFDSFQGLPVLGSIDSQGKDFAAGQYACSETEFRRNLAKAGVPSDKVITVPGWFEDTCTAETMARHQMKKAAIVHIDCDLYSSAKTALSFIEPLLADGTVLIFDDWYSFRGNPRLGEQRAFGEWKSGLGDWVFSEYHKDGPWSNSFIASRRIV